MKRVQATGDGDSGIRSGFMTKVTEQLRGTQLLRIACVESDPFMYSRVEQILNSYSPEWSVGRYGTGAQALSAVPMVRPEVVLMNNDLPDIPGVECTNRLKRLVPELHVVLCGPRGDFNDVFRALASGASGYLVAPASDAELVSAVKRGEEGLPFLCDRALAALFNGLHKCGSLYEDLLSRREQQVMASLVADRSDKGVAEALHIAPSTARVHVKHLLNKLRVHDRTEAIKRYLRVK